MSEITQVRLSKRLDIYLREYMAKVVKIGTFSKQKWDTVWQVADSARIEGTLTPELVDDVRIALNKL